MMLPPNAGRVCARCRVSSWIWSPVQSAVRPVPSSTATRGMSALPMQVAPAMTISGFCSRMIRARILA